MKLTHQNAKLLAQHVLDFSENCLEASLDDVAYAIEAWFQDNAELFPDRFSGVPKISGVRRT